MSNSKEITAAGSTPLTLWDSYMTENRRQLVWASYLLAGRKNISCSYKIVMLPPVLVGMNQFLSYFQACPEPLVH